MNRAEPAAGGAHTTWLPLGPLHLEVWTSVWSHVPPEQRGVGENAGVRDRFSSQLWHYDVE